MFFFHNSREEILSQLPQQGTVLEIGTAEGDFAESILHLTSPGRLHLVDPWEFQAVPAYQNDPNNVPGERADSRYEGVRSRFQASIENDTVAIHRLKSQDAASLFGEGYFDWIYIDGMHTREAALNDLRVYAPKVKENGFIVGHDYANNPDARHMNFGVVEAVNQFVRESGWYFLGLTVEMFPTYILVRSERELMENMYVHAMLANLSYFVEIKGFEHKKFQQKLMKDENDDSIKLLYSVE